MVKSKIIACAKTKHISKTIIQTNRIIFFNFGLAVKYPKLYEFPI